MITKLSTFFLLLLPLFSVSQCIPADVIPFKHNITKFDAIRSANFSPAYTADEIQIPGVWTKPEYLKDSVYRDQYNLIEKYNNCFSQFDECDYYLLFADDKLFRQGVIIKYNPNSYSTSWETYQNLIKVFTEKYPLAEQMEIIDKNNNTKIGESWIFQLYTKSPEKIKQISIEFSIKYKVIKGLSPSIQTNQVDNYVIEVESVDLTQTKLTNEGF